MTDYIQADLRDTDTIFKGAARTLDLTRPVAVARLMDAVPSGSYLVIAHAAADIAPEASAEMARRYNQMASATVTSTPPPAPWSATAPSPANPDASTPDHTSAPESSR